MYGAGDDVAALLGQAEYNNLPSWQRFGNNGQPLNRQPQIPWLPWQMGQGNGPSAKPNVPTLPETVVTANRIPKNPASAAPKSPNINASTALGVNPMDNPYGDMVHFATTNNSQSMAKTTPEGSGFDWSKAQAALGQAAKNAGQKKEAPKGFSFIQPAAPTRGQITQPLADPVLLALFGKPLA